MSDIEKLDEDEELCEFLKGNDVNIGRKSGTNVVIDKRKQVFNYIQQVLESWVVQYLQKGYPEDIVSLNHVKVVPCGSYALGLANKDSDVDVVCLSSNKIKRFEFFSSFNSFAQSQPRIKHVKSLEMIHCPILEMVVDDIKLDLTLAVLNCPSLPQQLKIDDDDDDDELLEGIDEKSLKSLNGYRNVIAILKLVPDENLFKTLLSAVKFWAERKCIYSHPIGYLGGMSSIILVAYICMEFPGLTLSLTLKKFFEVFSKWHWPKPVCLRELANKKSDYNSWDKKVDYKQLMPIITPCFPHQNSAFNVTLSGKSAIAEELRKAYSILQDASDGSDDTKTPQSIYNCFNFFSHFRMFLVIVIKTHKSLNDHLSWEGLVRSRIRLFINELDKKPVIQHARVFNQYFLLTNEAEEYLTKWYVGLDMVRTQGGGLRLDLVNEIRQFLSIVNNRAGDYGWERQDAELKVTSSLKRKEDPNGEEVKSFLPKEYENFYLVPKTHAF